jgi:carbonyl reductase 1
MNKLLVTGGNAGIGFALCRQLVIDHECHVFLGSRSSARGAEAVSSIQSMIPDGCKGLVELLTLDVGSDESVLAAAETLKSKLGGDRLYGIVNNAGVGPQHSDPVEIVNVNLFGPRRIAEAFGSYLNFDGYIVNVGSGSGPSYVKNCPVEIQKLLCTPPESWEQIVSLIDRSSDGKSGVGSAADGMGGYGPSKALLASYTMLLARENPSWKVSCCSPGFINTKLTAGWGATKMPDEGTLAIKKCLFEPLKGNGWYYGSDGLRSPYHFMRNPGEPEYDGTPPY